MQAVILAGGRGTRMGDITKETPKPLLKVADKSLIAHKLDRLPPEVDEIILVVSYLKDQFVTTFGNHYESASGKKHIVYVDQGEPQGTGHALWQARPLLRGTFLVMMGDDIYGKEAISAIINAQEPWAVTVVSVQSFKDTFNIVIDSNSQLNTIESDDFGAFGEINLDVCLYKFDMSVFDAPLQKLKTKEEFGLPHTVLPYACQKKIATHVYKTTAWCKINDQTDLSKAEQMLQQNII